MNALNALNFSAGPGALPGTVLQAAQEAIVAVPEVGLSILGISHRSDWFASVVDETERNIRRLLDLPETHAVLLLQGGATLQFSMVPMLLLRDSGKAAEYVRGGYWSRRSIPPARLEGEVRVLWDGEALGYRRLPAAEELHCSPEAAYFHYVSNETVEGIQFHEIPGREEVPRICDMSSDFLSRPFDAGRFDLIYAHAQKNLGPAGVTLVVIRRDLLERVPAKIPSLLDYRAHLEARSIYNTPPVFAIYVVLLVTRWLLDEIGGLNRMAEINRRKADALYGIIDGHSDIYLGWANSEHRSLMNVTFNLPTPELEQTFAAEAAKAGFSGLKGHRSLGGIRASIYNAMTLDAVESLCGFMTDFASRSDTHRGRV
ncbi:phosphoserine transaminase [Imhoffiella purpurea]|uniref:Phosphoserine aminotransferase n=1 Tax=Imhoffiella purpurea TaxID=1249627 RepID=W9V1S4_9GAMM|nr:phosphoserine transaminase [Imhoffiella purpurea]EXJ13418.1 Phosphoserine aminotransferase [Imhoffiella purpurea]